MRYTTLALSLAMAALSLTTPTAQEKVDRDIQWKIRREATDNSQILRTLHYLIDVYGPRLTGSPNLKAAQDWVVKETMWSGEEQGLLGSQAHVQRHFGMAEDPKPEHANFAGYFNIDSGTGRARGMSVFGPADAAAILREATKPFEDNGFFGVNATQSRRRGGTDSMSFNEAGLPGIGIQQDPIEYNSHTWHTNLDTYERIIEDDARQSAMVIAAAVYHLAMRDEKLPRLPKDKMPPLPTP